jgi:transcription elongation factor GreA-like protein
MTNNFYEEYSIKRILDTQLNTLFLNLDIIDPKDKFQHVEHVCERVLNSTDIENLEELTSIIQSYVKEKRQEYLQDGTQQAG